GNKDKQILNFDPEIEWTLRKLKKQSKQAHKDSSEKTIEKVFDNMAVEGTQEKTLREYYVPTTVSCGSSTVRPTVDANNFELKPSLIQLVQQEQFYGNLIHSPRPVENFILRNQVMIAL
ncbi:hypothetical protein PIB30_071684, partial [Stylosanthes scabra]|nr:hypothetical protein [Stylosanthes scabra]